MERSRQFRGRDTFLMSEQVTPGDNTRDEFVVGDAERMVLAAELVEGGLEFDRSAVARLLRVGSVRVSPVTREALIAVIANRLSWPSLHWKFGDPDMHRAVADAIMPLLSVSPPAEVEWGTARHDEAGNLFDEWGYVSYEMAVFDIDNSISEDDLVLIQRTKGTEAGPWLPVTPGEGKER